MLLNLKQCFFHFTDVRISAIPKTFLVQMALLVLQATTACREDVWPCSGNTNRLMDNGADGASTGLVPEVVEAGCGWLVDNAIAPLHNMAGNSALEIV